MVLLSVAGPDTKDCSGAGTMGGLGLARDVMVEAWKGKLWGDWWCSVSHRVGGEGRCCCSGKERRSLSLIAATHSRSRSAESPEKEQTRPQAATQAVFKGAFILLHSNPFCLSASFHQFCHQFNPKPCHDYNTMLASALAPALLLLASAVAAQETPSVVTGTLSTPCYEACVKEPCTLCTHTGEDAICMVHLLMASRRLSVALGVHLQWLDEHPAW